MTGDAPGYPDPHAAGDSACDDPVHPAPSVPPRWVLEAFGADGEPVVLPGGEGRSVRVGGAVFKPAGDVAEACWRARVLTRVNARLGSSQTQQVRVPRPLSTRQGEWTAGGWTASEYLPGTPGPTGRWHELLRAGREFHRALRHEPCPALLAWRDHVWAVADRVAWGEEDARPLAPLDGPIRGLSSLRRPVEAASQVIHGDLTGNVLFDGAEPPVVIDFSPYCRPVAYAEAVVVVDALLYHDAGLGLAESVADAWPGTDFPQLLLRALLFRLVTLNESACDADSVPAEELRRFTAVAGVVADYAG